MILGTEDSSTPFWVYTSAKQRCCELASCPNAQIDVAEFSNIFNSMEKGQLKMTHKPDLETRFTKELEIFINWTYL